MAGFYHCEVTMPDAPMLLLFSLAAIALLLLPGPAVLYIVTRSVEQGRAAGLVSVLGIEAGALFHVAAATLGLSALLVSSAQAFDMVRFAGAGYLVYLGVRKLLQASRPEMGLAPRRQPLRRVFVDGVVVNALNPKMALFFFAFLPQFADVSRGAVSTQILFLGGVWVVLATLSDGAYALLGARLGAWLRRNTTYPRVGRWLSGGVYLALGGAAALSSSKTSS
jgi:threonine/homoserine/homoserine lactone efflux protein